MQALRTRAACAAARRTPPTALRTSRSYASESHGHDHGHGEHHHHSAHHQVEEGLGASFYAFVGAIPLSILGYKITRPGPDGEPAAASKWLAQFDYFNEFETRNALRTQAIEQAAHDKHLFLHSGKNMHIELKMPELINSGSSINVPAGHYPNLDHVTEHYRNQAAVEEERKVKRLALLASQRAAEAEAKEAAS
ncbi:hypothetical protein F4775DRAFT_543806 [Biscogniauxia sp. FL1348]|nr:hypothetical protein F4775DRAFT_543806 [Biscogniauxia sp. FL1348]